MSEPEKKGLKSFFEEIQSLDIENYQDWSKPTKIFSWVIVGVVTVVAGLIFSIRPVLNSASALAADRVVLIDQFKDKQKQLNQIDSYKDQLARLELIFQQQLNQLPKENEIPGLVDDLNRAGKTSGLTLGVLSLADEAPREFFIEQPISVSAKGDFHSFGKFADSIAALPRIVTLQDYSVNIPKEGIDSSGGNLEIKVNAVTYRYLDQNATIKVEGL